MNEGRKTKKKLISSIRTIDEYNEYINCLKLSDSDKNIAYLVFVKGFTYNQIGDELGFSESTIKHRMRRILDKM